VTSLATLKQNRLLSIRYNERSVECCCEKSNYETMYFLPNIVDLAGLLFARRKELLHVATPTNFGVKWRYGANKTRGIERKENGSERL
jgi:hypothetical protein